MKHPTRAIVLAAGQGKRLRPYTNHTPKPLLPFNKRPTLDYILTALQTAGVADVCIVTHYLTEQIEKFVENGPWGLQISCCRQPDTLGTGHAVQIVQSFISEPCFIVAGDYLIDRTYLLELKKAYLEAGTDMVVSLKQLSPERLANSSSVRFGENGRILEIVEKPAPGTAPSQLSASLIFIVPPVIQTYLKKTLQQSSRQEYEIQGVLNRMLADGYTMTGLLQKTPAEWHPGLVRES